MSANNGTKIWLGLITLVGVLVAAVLGNWEKFGAGRTPSSTPALVSQSGSNNVQLVGSSNVVNPPPAPKACRDKTHGVERYERVFNVTRTSHWMGGGYSQIPWCKDVIAFLTGEHPDSEFAIGLHSERSKNTCRPFNCPQYKYKCEVQVKTDPVYVEKVSSACG